MKSKELAKLSVEDLNKKLEELRRDVMKTKTQIATGSAPKNAGQVRQMKKAVARVLTFINQKTQ